MPGSCSRSEDASQMAPPCFEVASWALDGVSAGGYTSKLVGGGCYKELVLAFYHTDMTIKRSLPWEMLSLQKNYQELVALDGFWPS